MNILRGLCFVFCFLVVIDWQYAAAQNCPKFDGFPGRVKLRRKGARATFKCNRKSTLYGPKRLNCRNDGTWDAQPPICIKTGCIPVDISSHENLDMSEKHGGALLTFSCEQGYNIIGFTEAYCDGNKWSAPLPDCRAPKELTECDFEDADLCGWTQGDDDQRDWMRNNGPTATGNTGPTHDHTLGEAGLGHYMFFETSNPTTNGDVARLISPLFTADMSPRCFDFWYHILGPDDINHVGALDVYVLPSAEFIDDMQPLFTVEGNKGNVWHRGEITIAKQSGDYQIVIAATRKLSYISDIAIDDVRLFNCTQDTTTTATPSTTTSQTITTSVSIATSSKTADVTTTRIASTVSTMKTPSSQPPTSSKQFSTGITFPVSSTKTTTILSPQTTTRMMTTPPTATAATETTRSATIVTSEGTMTTLESETKTPGWTTLKPTKPPTQTSPTPQTTLATTTEKPKTSPVVTTTFAPTTMEKTTTTKATTRAIKTTTTAVPTTRKAPASTTAATPATSTTTKTTPRTTPIVTTPVPRTPSTMVPSTRKVASKEPSVITSTQRTTPEQTTEQTATSSASTVAPVQTTNTGTTKTTLSNKITTQTPQTGSTLSTDKVTGTSHPNAIDEDPTTNQTVSVSHTREKHPEDDTLKPLMIGLGVGVVVGLIIIGAVVWLCVRRRKLFYTQMSEDELKPITHAGSSHSLNNLDFYQDEEFETNS